MTNRWRILALLFTVRVTMGFQFQAVGALSPFLMERYGVGLADIGLVIGLYLSPGIVIALPGGAIGRRFGDKRAVAGALGLMLAGGILIVAVPAWEAQIAGRLLAGIGGVVLNVLMSKMVTDWFRDGELATAMGIFVNSWPVAIAAALVILPPLAAGGGVEVALGLSAALVAVALVLLLALYRDAPGAAPGGAASAKRPPIRPVALTGLVAAAGIWGLYNVALAMVFSFGPTMLVERGWEAAAAGGTTSLALWLAAVSVPLGGWLADRMGRRDAVLAGGLAGTALVMLIAPWVEAGVALFAAIGLVGGIAAGPIMSLPGPLLSPANRAHGMGIFFTVFYVAIFAGPTAAGLIAERAGDAGAAFTFGAAALVACLLLLALHRAAARRHAGQAAPA